MAKYKALVGMDYPSADGTLKRVEAGTDVDDLPAKSVGWLREQGLIAPTSDITSAPAPAPEKEA